VLTKNEKVSVAQRTKKASRKVDNLIGFRLPEEYLRKLNTIATKRGKNKHAQACEMLMALLDGDTAELIAVRIKVEEMTARFEQYITGMADVMEAVLVMSGGKAEKVRPWIEERLRKRVIN
jgi:hypothetical protein